MSLSAWVSDNEHEWRECLKPVRLVVETEFTADEVRAAHKRSCIRVGPSVEGGPSGPSPRLRRDMVRTHSASDSEPAHSVGQLT
ncbi:uncharacterized protein PO1_contig-018-9 [Mycobacterium sp. PO1]|nr:uncharacterized protein PO1_contig-018-9 [Mycobacterium sp. PO1]GFM21890.1 uncharacterized protein PO2_contig-002-173 [Mycobacterium sp. PO2]